MFDGFIRDHACWTPRAPAVILPGRQVSYAQFDADIDRLGAALADRGVGPGIGVVAVALESPYLQLAAMAMCIAMLRARSLNRSLRATKSVSLLSSTITASFPLWWT